MADKEKQEKGVPMTERWGMDEDFGQIPDCNRCKHYLKDGKCKAFPEMIPDEILFGEIKHTEVLPGQVGSYVYEALKT